MGGHVGGEVASRTVADGVLEFIRATAMDPDKTWPFGIDPELSQPANRLQVAIRCANQKLAELVSADTALGGTGATISAALFAEDRLVVSNLGDCRAYLVRDGQAFQITRDHSYVAEQVALGLLDNEEARHHPLRHMVTRAVSGEAGIFVDTWEIKVEPATACCSAPTACTRCCPTPNFRRSPRPRSRSTTSAASIVDAAKREGGTDNSTVILVAVS